MQFSVIVPAFNAGHTLRKTLDSLVALDSKNDLEIILINDGSSDNTEEIALAYSGAIRYLFQQNKGVSAARNEGVRIAKGEWLIFIDADDEACLNRISEVKALLENESTADLIISDQYFVNESGEIIDSSFARAAKISPYVGQIIGHTGPVVRSDYGCLIHFGLLEVRALTVRRSVFLKVGGFPVGIKVGEDLILGVRLLAFAQRVRLLNKPLAKYCILPNSVLRKDATAANLSFVAALENFQREVSDYPISIQAGYSTKFRQVVLDACNALIRSNRHQEAIILVSRMLFRKNSAMKLRDLASVIIG